METFGVGTAWCCHWHSCAALCTSGAFNDYCFTSLSWMENQTSRQNSLSAGNMLTRSALVCTWAHYALLSKPQCLDFFLHPYFNIILVITGFLWLIWAKCWDRIFAGLHPVFYEPLKKKTIKTAKASLQWCELSVAVTELLHLSQGRGEVCP